MDISTIYAIAAGAIILLFILARGLYYLRPLKSIVTVLILRHLSYPYFLNRHRFVGPWTREGVLLRIVYLAANAFCLLFSPMSVSAVSHRAGKLSLVNMTFLYLAPHLSLLADILGVSIRNCRRIHRSSAWMCAILLAVHVAIAFHEDGDKFSVQKADNFFAIMGSSSVALIMLLPSLRRIAYECFLRAHQGLAGLVLYSTWRHLPGNAFLPRCCCMVSLGSLGITSLFQLIIFCYQNGVFMSCGHPRAYIYCDGLTKNQGDREDDAETGRAIKARIVLPRPMKFDPGQYINVWMPTLSLLSWTQVHPFTVTSWSREEQSTLDLYVEAQSGLTAILRDRARTAPQGWVSLSSFITGPHGTSEPLEQYDSVLLVASDGGIAAVLPYVKKLINDHNTSTSRTRRVHLVWQLKTLDMAIPAESSLNSLLKDDASALNGLLKDDTVMKTLWEANKLVKGYILTMSVYVESGGIASLGNHDRAFVYKGLANYEDIIQAEVSGNIGISNAEEAGGSLRVIVSATGTVRDQIRYVVRGFLHDSVTMSELDYQPK